MQTDLVKAYVPKFWRRVSGKIIDWLITLCLVIVCSIGLIKDASSENKEITAASFYTFIILSLLIVVVVNVVIPTVWIKSGGIGRKLTKTHLKKVTEINLRTKFITKEFINWLAFYFINWLLVIVAYQNDKQLKQIAESWISTSNSFKFDEIIFKTINLVYCFVFGFNIVILIVYNGKINLVDRRFGFTVIQFKKHYLDQNIDPVPKFWNSRIEKTEIDKAASDE